MKINSSQQLIRKIKLLQKHSNKVLISHDTLTTDFIQIKIQPFCDFECGMEISDLLELAKHPGDVQIEDHELYYTYLPLPDVPAQVHKTITLLDIQNSFPTGSPALSIRIPSIPILTEDDVNLSYSNGKLAISSYGHISTRGVVLSEKIEGNEGPSCTVRAKSLEIINDLEGERVISFYDTHVVAYGLEPDSLTAVLIQQLNTE